MIQWAQHHSIGTLYPDDYLRISNTNFIFFPICLASIYRYYLQSLIL